MTTPDPRIAQLAEELLSIMLDSDPLEATLIGYRDYDAKLADLSAEHDQEMRTRRAKVRAAAEAIDPSSLSDQDAITRAVIIAQTTYADMSDDVQAIEFTVSAFPVSPASVLCAYLRMIVLTNADEARAYLQRLHEIPRYLKQAEDRLSAGRNAGLVPVAHLVQMAIDQLDTFIAASPSPLALPAPNGVEDEWVDERDRIIADVALPAFQSYRDHLNDVVMATGRDREHPGLRYLPDGYQRYRNLIAIHTTTDRTPEELHDLGKQIVASIHDEFRVLGDRVLGTSEIPEIFERLSSDPELRWESADDIIAAAEATVRRAEAASADWFGNRPLAVCELDVIPEVEAEGAPPAYYMPPALDGSRPGTYYTNVNQPQNRTSFDLESVAFHEAVPGHHFQVSLAQELPDLPVIRRLSMFTAYVEGWGLYAERLADEMNLYSSDMQRLGMLAADAWRAARLVVDTGLHAMGWSREQALDYLVAHAPLARIDAESEIDRYIAYPGQALSYMTGRLEIERLRTVAQDHLADRFDIRDFHDVVLGSGALPLSVLDEVVSTWLEKTDA